jgi:hypothetical protein
MNAFIEFILRILHFIEILLVEIVYAGIGSTTIVTLDRCHCGFEVGKNSFYYERSEKYIPSGTVDYNNSYLHLKKCHSSTCP